MKKIVIINTIGDARSEGVSGRGSIRFLDTEGSGWVGFMVSDLGKILEF